MESAVGLRGLAEVLGASCEQDVYAALAEWNTRDHAVEADSSDQLPTPALQRLSVLLWEACRSSWWQEAFTASSAFMAALTLSPAGISTGLLNAGVGQGANPLSKISDATMMVLCSWCKDAEDRLLAGEGGDLKPPLPDDALAQQHQTRHQTAATLAVLAGFLRELVPACGFADRLLASPGFCKALLSAAATSESSPVVTRCGSLLGEAVVSFSALQARRGLAELLATLLEEASPAVRAAQEHTLLADLQEPGCVRLVETLVLARPDPKLHELLLELLWRGLRRFDDQTAASPAYQLLVQLTGETPPKRLQEVSSEQLLDWGPDLALQLSKKNYEVMSLPHCHISWGGLHIEDCGAVFSPHSLVVEGMFMSGATEALSGEEEAEQQGEEIMIEVPWACVQSPDLAVARGLPLHLPVDVEALCRLGLLTPTLASLVSLPEAALQISSSADGGEATSALEQLNALFLGASQDSSGQCGESGTFQESATFRNVDPLSSPQSSNQAVVASTLEVGPSAGQKVETEESVTTPPPSQYSQAAQTAVDFQVDGSRTKQAESKSQGGVPGQTSPHTPVGRLTRKLSFSQAEADEEEPDSSEVCEAAEAGVLKESRGVAARRGGGECPAHNATGELAADEERARNAEEDNKAEEDRVREAEEARLVAEEAARNAQEDARLRAAEEAAAQKAEEERLAAEAAKAAAARAAEEERLQKAEEERVAAEAAARKAEEDARVKAAAAAAAHKAEEERLAAEAARAAAARAAEEERLRKVEEERMAAEAAARKAEEDARGKAAAAAAAHKAEEERLAAEAATAAAQKAEEERLAAEAARAAAAKAAEEEQLQKAEEELAAAEAASCTAEEDARVKADETAAAHKADDERLAAEAARVAAARVAEEGRLPSAERDCLAAEERKGDDDARVKAAEAAAAHKAEEERLAAEATRAASAGAAKEEEVRQAEEVRLASEEAAQRAEEKTRVQAAEAAAQKPEEARLAAEGATAASPRTADEQQQRMAEEQCLAAEETACEAKLETQVSEEAGAAAETTEVAVEPQEKTTVPNAAEAAATRQIEYAQNLEVNKSMLKVEDERLAADAARETSSKASEEKITHETKYPQRKAAEEAAAGEMEDDRLAASGTPCKATEGTLAIQEAGASKNTVGCVETEPAKSEDAVAAAAAYTAAEGTQADQKLYEQQRPFDQAVASEAPESPVAPATAKRTWTPTINKDNDDDADDANCNQDSYADAAKGEAANESVPSETPLAIPTVATPKESKRNVTHCESSELKQNHWFQETPQAPQKTEDLEVRCAEEQLRAWEELEAANIAAAADATDDKLLRAELAAEESVVPNIHPSASSQPGGALNLLTIRELRHACLDLDLPTHGSKGDIVKRLMMHADSVMTPPQSLGESQLSQQFSQANSTSDLLKLPDADSLPQDSEGNPMLKLPDSASLPAAESAGAAEKHTGTEIVQEASSQRLAPIADEEQQSSQMSSLGNSMLQLPEADSLPREAEDSLQLVQLEENEHASPAQQSYAPGQQLPQLRPEEAGSLVQDLSVLSVKQLRQACKDQGLPSTGNKAALIDRLAQLVSMHTEAAPAPSEEALEEPEKDKVVQAPAKKVQVGNAVDPAEAECSEKLWVPATRSPLRGGATQIRDADAEQRPAFEDAAVAAATYEVVAALARDLSALPLQELRKACRLRGLPSDGIRSELVGRLAALMAPGVSQGGVEDRGNSQRNFEPSATTPPGSEDVPSSLDGLGLPALRAACLACGLPADGDEAALTSRLAMHMASQAEVTTGQDAEAPEEPAGSAKEGAEDKEDVVKKEREDERDMLTEEALGLCEAGTPRRHNQDKRDETHRDNVAHGHSPLGSMDIPAAQPDLQDGIVGGCAGAVPCHAASPQRLEDGVRAGLRLLHTEELRRACAERGLETTGKKGVLLTRLLDYAAKAPAPTPSEASEASPQPESKRPRLQDARPGGTVSHVSSVLVHQEPEPVVNPEPQPGDQSLHLEQVVQHHEVEQFEKTGDNEQQVLVQQVQREQPTEQEPAREQARQLQASFLKGRARAAQAQASVGAAQQGETIQSLAGPLDSSLLKRPRSELSLLKRGRNPEPAAGPTGPNLAGLWQTMSAAKPTARTANARPATHDFFMPAEGVGLTLRPPAHGKLRIAGGGISTGYGSGASSAAGFDSRLRSRSRRAEAVGTCHAWTAAGIPCRCVGQHRTPRARFAYCGKHAAKWARFESVTVDELPHRARLETDQRHRELGSTSMFPKTDQRHVELKSTGIVAKTDQHHGELRSTSVVTKNSYSARSAPQTSTLTESRAVGSASSQEGCKKRSAPELRRPSKCVPKGPLPGLAPVLNLLPGQ
eukprot:TRINITY_DN2363_c0_g1_i6.p1 TRINITY_DN2363_c0_g1~~TRINITY_DN2363_c0_g1_i6.p1  ORF type:complete len:2350 (-),score=650.32 TRINITY_DN2363_c0_g1_i6:17-7066(-)